MWVIILGAVIAGGATTFTMALRERRVVEEELSELSGDGFDKVRANYDRAMAAGMWRTTRPVVVRTAGSKHQRPVAA